MRKEDNIEKAVRQIELVDTGVSVLCGLMVIPAVFAFSNGNPDAINLTQKTRSRDDLLHCPNPPPAHSAHLRISQPQGHLHLANLNRISKRRSRKRAQRVESQGLPEVQGKTVPTRGYYSCKLSPKLRAKHPWPVV